MRAEYALAGRGRRTHDFREGVRAVLIDKDNAPQWDPATPEEVTDEMLDEIFAPLPDGEAWTPFPKRKPLHDRLQNDPGRAARRGDPRSRSTARRR